MKSKSEVFQLFVNFFCLVQNQFGKSIDRIRSNNGTEYVNHDSTNLLHNSIVHETNVKTFHNKTGLQKA